METSLCLFDFQRHINRGRSICAICGGVEPNQAVKNGQRDTIHNTSYVKQLQYNTVHNKTLQLQHCNNRLSNHMTYLLKYYVSCLHQYQTRSHTHPIWYNFTRFHQISYDLSIPTDKFWPLIHEFTQLFYYTC